MLLDLLPLEQPPKVTGLGEVDPSTNRLLVARLRAAMKRHEEEELLLALIEV